MNKGFYPSLDINFEQACKLCETDFTHAELISLLQNGNLPEKQIAAMKFDRIDDENDAKLLLSNLIGCDGKIREAVALKINQILADDISSKEIFAKLSAETFAKATIDINGNICRLTVNNAGLLKNFPTFSEKYAIAILEFIKEALNELDKFIFRDKKYIINKQIFKLYWCLETLKNFYNYIPTKTLILILLKCTNLKEYTIREKTAQLAILSPKFKDVILKLQNDDNYYVKIVLNKL